jgi:hypothetical protein
MLFTYNDMCLLEITGYMTRMICTFRMSASFRDLALV